jgi:two-component system NtrC family sensor kinase
MKDSSSRDVHPSQADPYAVIAQRILAYANRGTARIEFLTGISAVLLEFLECDAVELRLRDPDLSYRWEFTAKPERSAQFTLLTDHSKERVNPPKSKVHHGNSEGLCREVMRGRLHPESPCFTKRGSYWTGNQPAIEHAGSTQADKPARSGSDRQRPAERTVGVGPYRSFALIRFSVDERTVGLLQLKSLQRSRFSRKKVEFCERVAETLGLAIANRRAQWALRERVKELTCLYGIGRIAQLAELSLDEALQRVVELLPPAWQFPEIACARITLDGRAFTTAGFRDGTQRQDADLTVNGKLRGCIEVVYAEGKTEFPEGPFLAEERSLIDTVAREVALIVERRETEAYQSALQAQLRHADRLATIGQLAAGVAHELNEPLGSILGFAQLIQKEPDLPETAAKDVERIVKASLRAREVIQKLLVFSRQKTPVKAPVNLNRIVEEALYFLGSRCAAAGIALSATLAQDLPEIGADASQLHQVLVNLVVNSMQAMPEGGTLTIETRAGADCIWLSVQDTGLGIRDEIKEKIFTPFFTTKDVDQGTGLGLAVVHGIVTSHGGSISVESAPGKGARFEIRLPAAERHD